MRKSNAAGSFFHDRFCRGAQIYHFVVCALFEESCGRHCLSATAKRDSYAFPSKQKDVSTLLCASHPSASLKSRMNLSAKLIRIYPEGGEAHAV